MLLPDWFVRGLRAGVKTTAYQFLRNVYAVAYRLHTPTGLFAAKRASVSRRHSDLWGFAMKRRFFVKAGLLGGAAAATFAKPNIATAQAKTFQWKMTNAYGPGSPFYVAGPGSPTDFCEMVKKMSGGRLTIQHFAAGELIPALEGFDAVSKGIVEMNAANSYFWAGKIPAAQYFTTVPFGLNLGHDHGSIMAAARSCGTNCTRPSAWCRWSWAIPACR